MLSLNGDLVTERTLTVLTEAARRAGADPDVETLAPTRHEIDGVVFVPASEYRAVLQEIFATSNDLLGIELARHLPVDASGLWGFLLRSSPTFGDMLYRAARYMRVFYRYTGMTLTAGADGLHLVCHHPETAPFGCRAQEVCFFLGQWVTWGRVLVGPDTAARRVHMQWTGPKEPAPIEAFFGCRIVFGAEEDSILFDETIARRPLPERTPELTTVFEDYATAIIRHSVPATSLPEQVRILLAQGLPGGTAGEAEIAGKLGLTRRTLRRRLAEAGLTFQGLRQDLLQQRAERLLREGHLPISEIAFLLGYSEPSTFHRAFRGWKGTSPAAWRAERRA